MSDTGAGRIFLSYRRDDTRHMAGRLSDRLKERFGDANVFMDVDSIEPGLDFGEAIERAVGGSNVLLALIGKAWLSGTDEHGRRRLDDPDDLVLLEIKTALVRDIRVIPILVDGAAAPLREDLPEILAPLARRNAIRLDHETFRTDVGPLVDVLDRAARPSPPGVTSVAADRPARSSVPGAAPWQRFAVLQYPGKWFLGHSWVTDVVFSPDDRWLATVSDDGRIRLWDAASGMLHRSLDGMSSGRISFSSDSVLLAAGRYTTELWDVISGDHLRSLPSRDRGPRSGSVFSPVGGLLACYGRQQVALWDPRGADPLTVLVHGGDVVDASFSSDGRHLATVSPEHRSARIWDVPNGRPGHTLIHRDRVNTASFSTDGQWLATTCADRTAQVWSVAEGELHHTMAHNFPFGGRPAFSPNGKWLATYDTQTALWNVQSRALVRTFGVEAAVKGVAGLAFSTDGHWLANAMTVDTLVLWNLTDGPDQHTLPMGNSVSALAFSPSGRYLAVGTFGKRAVLWKRSG